MTLKEKLHRLIDDLPARELPAARRFLEYLRDAGGDPVMAALAAAPEDDEPFTASDEAAVAAGDRALARGRVVRQGALRPRKRR